MVLDLFDLRGRVAIVTGCSTGLGEAMAVGLAEAGASIVGVSSSPGTYNAKILIEGMGGRFLQVRADLSSIAPINGIIEKCLEAFGKVDILVNNAGIIRREDAVNFTENDWDDVMNVNIKSLFFLSQAVAKEFIRQGTGGKIINIASMLSFQGGIRVPSYTASKSGVMGITRLLANEWAKYNINVNAIAPGYMVTNNTLALRADQTRREEILGRIPAGRWGLPEDMKGPVIFLASEASNYMNGCTIAVDGGWLAR
ncbi:MAG: 2-dehydro-3-deoxy-D-gluconate 5-dehydrogenase KduD [Syntrophobacteraceae bacterium]